jgi:trk system potassium uptake protein TrkA
VLRDPGVGTAVAVVAIGEDLEASILATAALADLGVTEIWARAVTDAHGRILERVGAHWIVKAEQDMGDRVVQLIYKPIEEYVSFPNGYALALMDRRSGRSASRWTSRHQRSPRGRRHRGQQRRRGQVPRRSSIRSGADAAAVPLRR